MGKRFMLRRCVALLGLSVLVSGCSSGGTGGADDPGGCYCSICQAACLPVERRRGEECPYPPQWHHQWCEQAQCGMVDALCGLVGPEPVVDKDAAALDDVRSEVGDARDPQ